MAHYPLTRKMDTSATVSDAVGDGDEPPEPTGSTPIEITITLDESVGDVDALWLRDRATRAAAYLAATSVAIDVRVVTDATMAALHAQHGGVDGTTDVLTFDRGSDATSIDADIAVCVDEAARVAEERGHGVLEELLLYVIHGALHEDGVNLAGDIEDAYVTTDLEGDPKYLMWRRCSGRRAGTRWGSPRTTHRWC